MAVRELPKYESNRDNYLLVDNVHNFVHKLLKVENVPELLSVDTETYYNPALRPPQAITRFIKGSPNNRPFGVSFYDGQRGYWVDKHLHELAPLLMSDVDKTLHNSKYDRHMFLNVGLDIKGRILDTMHMVHLVDEEFMCKMPPDKDGNIAFKKSKALKNLMYHFGMDAAHELEDLVKQYRQIIAANTGRKTEEVSYKEVNDANPILMKDYAVHDTYGGWTLCKLLLPMMDEQALWRAYEIDINGSTAVLDLERNGVLMDVEAMKHDEKILTDIIHNRAGIVHARCNRDFSIDSDSELVYAFQSLGVEWSWFTESQNYKTDKQVMGILCKSPNEAIAEAAKAVLEYRKACKLLATYIQGVYPFIQQDGRIHCDFFLCPSDFDNGGTKTGRLSSASPNLQNVPKKPIELEADEDADTD